MFVDVRLEQETVWLNPEQKTELSQKGKSTINENIKNIFKQGGIYNLKRWRNPEIPNLLKNQSIIINLILLYSSNFIRKYKFIQFLYSKPLINLCGFLFNHK